jgi:nitrate reductase delta subunit
MVTVDEVKTRQRLFRLFADLLEYPQSDLSESVRECEALISPGNPEAAALLDPLRSFVADAPLGDIQELYTRTFDLDATYHPYVGHHLFGESYKRSAFMVGLKERYKAYDFVVEGELPDHLAVMLRYLSLCEDDVQVAEIVRDAMVPALERMVKKPADTAEDAPGEAALDGCALDVGAVGAGTLDSGALDVSAMDVGAMDVSAMDGCALDVSATDVGALDVGAMDAGAPGEDTPEQIGLEPGVYPQLLHALRLVLQQLPMNDRQPVMNLSP